MMGLVRLLILNEKIDLKLCRILERAGAKDQALSHTPEKQNPNKDAAMNVIAKTRIALGLKMRDVNMIMPMLRHKDESIREAAEKALASLGATKEQLVNGYIAALSSPDKEGYRLYEYNKDAKNACWQ